MRIFRVLARNYGWRPWEIARLTPHQVLDFLKDVDDDQHPHVADGGNPYTGESIHEMCVRIRKERGLDT